ncbi:MAG TPA: nucleotidyl transferase AbiEii/AbiGii toxin family protein [Planctomycetaceae bacterium]|nr:nucleotidyl transferase AbiEii/AbiGii toxin family protein [Planctomycetaceae bacterium]
MAAHAVLQTLEHVWKALEPLRLPMAVMGGLALSLWKRARATRDVDLLVGIGTHSPDELLTVLSSAGFRPKHAPPVRSLGGMQILQLEFDPRDAFVSISVDLLLVDSDYHRVALQRRTPARLESVSGDLFVLACEDLILHKLVAGRIIDRADAAALLRANRDSIDVGYLGKWAKHLLVTDELREVWGEAYGSQSPPPI